MKKYTIIKVNDKGHAVFYELCEFSDAFAIFRESVNDKSVKYVFVREDEYFMVMKWDGRCQFPDNDWPPNIKQKG